MEIETPCLKLNYLTAKTKQRSENSIKARLTKEISIESVPRS